MSGKSATINVAACVLRLVAKPFNGGGEAAF
jgi:hypothetical protein